MRFVAKDDGKPACSGVSLVPCCTGIALCAVIDFRNRNGIIHICIVRHQPDLCDIVHKYRVGRLDNQRAAGDAGVVRGGRIIRPRIRAVFVLPLADGHALNLCGQSCLCCTDQCGAGIVLEHIGVRCDIGKPRIFRIFHQRKRDIRGNIDGIFRLCIVIADIAQIGQHTGYRRRQLVFTDG